MKRDFTLLAGKHFDLLVCGGGIYGAWTAYDAALRGLSVAIVEQGDWASATSSASSKLIHGGLRYLETYDFKLVNSMPEARLRVLYRVPSTVPWLLRSGGACPVPSCGWCRVTHQYDAKTRVGLTPDVTYTPRKLGGVLHGFGIIGRDLYRYIMFVSDIQTALVYTAFGQSLQRCRVNFYAYCFHNHAPPFDWLCAPK